MEDASFTIVQHASVLGRSWAMPLVDEAQVQRAMLGYSLPELTVRLLVSRNVSFEDIPRFIDPKLAHDLPDPSHLLDMDQGIQRIVQALQNKERIVLWGDYDVDGATSTSLLYRVLKHYTDTVLFYIPDRFQEGYGPNLQGFQKLYEQGVHLIITLDCGTTARDVLAYAKNQGMDVIVIDHHGADDVAALAPAYALINPNRPDETSPLKPLAAVGLAFLVAVALNRALRDAPWCSQEPYPLLSLLDLVALGTVCDVVPLTGLNRTFVRQGLKVLHQTAHQGLKALVHSASLEQAHTPYHCGFVLGPRVNAGGRIGSSDLGTRLLTTEDLEEAASLAHHLGHLNQERQEIEKHLLAEALNQAQDQTEHSLVIVSGDDWHEGVIGIIAGRLKELLQKPTLVIAWSSSKGIGKGSGRSVPGFDLGQMIRQGVHEKYLSTGGGHSMAAGLSLTREQEPSFILWARAQADQFFQGRPRPPLRIDTIAPLHHLGADLFRALEHLEPFGAGHPQPRFMIRGLRIRYASVVGQDHVRCVFSAHTDRGGKGEIQGIAFRALQSPLGQALLTTPKTHSLSVAGTFHKNTWQGRETLQIYVDDLALED